MNVLPPVAFLIAFFSTVDALAQDGSLPNLPTAETTTYAAGACRLDDHTGVDEADARTAAQLLCTEISRNRPPANARYHVTLGKLGSLIIYGVTREGDTPDSGVDARELRLHGIEEAAIAAPRLAEAIVRGTALSETEKIDNLVGDETRRPNKKPGSVHFSLGLIGNLPPLDQGIGPAPGLDLHVHYETKAFELGGGIRFGGGRSSQTAPSMGFFMADVGGRYFLSDTDISPYVGGGVAWDYLNLSLFNGFTGNNAGLGAFVDAGVEILRTYHTHLSVGVRADLPFFSLDNNDSSCPTPCRTFTTYYYWPVSIEVRVTF